MALLFNPYGVALIRFLLRTATVPRPEISEWKPLRISSVPGVAFFGLLAVAIAAFAKGALPSRALGPGRVAWRDLASVAGTLRVPWRNLTCGVLGSRRVKLEAILIVAATAVLTSISGRHFPLFALAVVVMAADAITALWNRLTPAAWLLRGQTVWLAVVSLALCPILVLGSLPRFGYIRIDPFYFAFPARAVELLRQADARGNMVVPFDWGEYVIWHLGPAIQVSIDGRRETVYSEFRYAQSEAFFRGDAGWDTILKSDRADLILLPIGAPPARLLADAGGWLPLYRDACCLLFVRTDFAGLEKIMACPVPALPDNGAGLCFPPKHAAISASALSQSAIASSRLP
jgi:hypothetical protein